MMLSALTAMAQVDSIFNGLTYNVEASGNLSDGKFAPLWFSSGRFGLSSIEPNSGYVRAGISRSADCDSLHTWRFGYGLDVAVPVNFTSDFVLQQLYGTVQYKFAQLTLGTKEIDQEMLNRELSSGAMSLSNNARPIPQVRLEIPEFLPLHFTDDWVGIKGHLAYGWYTDNRWQRNFTNKQSLFSQDSHFHSKAAFIRIGRDDLCPFSATFGLQMSCQFGGTGYNIADRSDDCNMLTDVELGDGLKSYWYALIPGGHDVNDGNYGNVQGNQNGNWYFDMKFQGRGWSVRTYAEHFFEDHSQLFVQYAWKDMLWGVELKLPKNKYVSRFVAEYLNTRDQTGGLYHDRSDVVPLQISGRDDYYNHHTFGAWQHWGQAQGNPLLLSPIYNVANRQLYFYFNRVSAVHIGLNGEPTDELHYRLLFSNLRTWGTYDQPTLSPIDQNYLLAELTYNPKKYKGWSATLGYGLNNGDLIGNSNGVSFTIRKTAILR